VPTSKSGLREKFVERDYALTFLNLFYAVASQYVRA